MVDRTLVFSYGALRQQRIKKRILFFLARYDCLQSWSLFSYSFSSWLETKEIYYDKKPVTLDDIKYPGMQCPSHLISRVSIIKPTQLEMTRTSAEQNVLQGALWRGQLTFQFYVQISRVLFMFRVILLNIAEHELN